MNNQKTEDLSRRVGELESLAWALFRALETYITLNDLMRALDEEKSHEANSAIEYPHTQ